MTATEKRADAALIRNCIRYAQAIAAKEAGFDADPDGDFQDAVVLGEPYEKDAKDLLDKVTRAKATTVEGLFAKAAVLRALMRHADGCAISTAERDFLVSFANDIGARGRRGLTEVPL